MPKKDLTGQKFGKLTVLQDSQQRASNGGIIWQCRCDCGNIVNVAGNNLTRKTNGQISCGKCYKGLNLLGQKFNYLTVLERMDYKTGDSQVWKCQCDCGNITYVNTRNLRSGEVKSCGCLHKNNSNNTDEEYHSKYLTIGDIINNLEILERTNEKTSTNYFLYKCRCIFCDNISFQTSAQIKRRKGKYCSKCHIKNLQGQKFNKLTVLALDNQQTQEKHRAQWKCQCECGNICIVDGSNLQNGNTKSCGCLKDNYLSMGAQKIKNLLDKYHIIYEQEKTFESCRFQKTNLLARFDFYLPNYNTLIEYDGEQHFKETSFCNDSLKERQARDEQKNLWCKKHNIILIRIPYTHREDIILDDLLPMTSSFIYK